ncbi:MAG: isoleucine--tRNA ligase [Hyphomicrobiales bacterium]|nr:isoleucine--tRNA ligase [Hyphomicrobiales bacterium]
MTDVKTEATDYSSTLFLPRTEFPMRGGLPQKEPEILARWAKINLYQKLREAGQGRDKFVLHDGPPYANGNIHIGHSLNKILKDLVTRSQQMLGKDSNYVPGWDCHGLPIEWKIEEEYRAKGLNKDAVPVAEFRRQCRAFAQKWVDVQREEFKRLGITGDWDHPYLTMTYAAEAQIAREIMKFAGNGLLYRGSKPVMWSVVEKTALAEAEVEYEDHVSDTVYVAFPVKSAPITHPNQPGPENAKHAAFMAALNSASVVIWTTTPWTLPGNRAVAFSPRVPYALYRVTAAPEGNWLKTGATYILAEPLAGEVFAAAKVENYEKLAPIEPFDLGAMLLRHPLAGADYTFDVPLLEGEHVTADTGTGFVHTAPGHGREDFDLWTAHGQELARRGIDTRIPYTVDEDGFYTNEVPGFGPTSTGGHPARVLDQNGRQGDANARIIEALAAAGHLVARGKLKHQYPHSWRSKKPIIFRNTPQWFIAMDKAFALASGKDEASLRAVALAAIEATRWVPASGQNRINGMIANRPDWVVSRQRAWGVPLAVFVSKADQQTILLDDRVNRRIAEAFDKEGADAWFAPDAARRFLAPEHDPADYIMVQDVLDVWFDSGSTHAFVLDDRQHFPALANILRKIRGGRDEVMYLEGTDQHRGWFHSSLLESCGTRGEAPYDVVLTHGFTLDEKGRKMSKSLGNTVVPQKIIEQSGADILRLWVASVDFTDDQRIGPEILKSVSDTYRKLRNTLRWMLGTLAHHDAGDALDLAALEGCERLMLHRLSELDATVRAAFLAFDYNKVLTSVSAFMVTDLSAFYFDVRKDALYCDAPSSARRRGALAVIAEIFRAVTTWLAPILVFTCEEAWLQAYPDAVSVHLETFPVLPAVWRDEVLAADWAKIRKARAVVTGALEIARANKEIGSSLEASPEVYVTDPALFALLGGVDFAEICITSGINLLAGEGPADAFRLADAAGVAVVNRRAEGIKCARSWKYFDPATALPGYPGVTPRDAVALQELGAMAGQAS